LARAVSDYEAIERALTSPVLSGLGPIGEQSLLFGSSARTSGPAGAPIISQFHRGKTFVYDLEFENYRVDPERDGAPATGVRFITYATDAAGRPIVGQETGYADLVDEGDGSAEDVALHLLVRQGAAAVLDYSIRADDTGHGGTLAVGGFLQGADRLEFTVDVEGRHDELDVDFDLGIDARDFEVSGSVYGAKEGESGEGEIEIHARHGTHSFTVDVTGDDDMIDGTIELDDRLFATVSGPAAAPVFLGASGRPLTPLELLVVLHLVDVSEDLFDLLEDLVDPADNLIFLGAIL
jgi:hypothetical protein